MAQQPGAPDAPSGRPPLRFAMVCASNMNRSMEAHAALAAEGLEVSEREQRERETPDVLG